MMDCEKLDTTARQLVAAGKGILAVDESFGTIRKRFDAVGVESTEENRRLYRQLLLTADGVEAFISGAILFDETLRQKADDGRTFAAVLTDRGILPGIKVDAGTKPFPLHPGEKVTEGLDGLRERLAEYRNLGARFAKWRAVIKIDGGGLPSESCLEANAHALARYAGHCQEAGIVPIVEPEVLMDGPHDLARCEEVTERALRVVFNELRGHRVRVEGMLLKPSMVIAGKESSRQADVKEVAEATIRCLRRTVPAAVPGIVFLSGGQSPELATAHLNEMNLMGPQPWEVGFSYGRALQEPALKAWRGQPENVKEAEQAFLHRARCNGEARRGLCVEERGRRSA